MSLLEEDLKLQFCAFSQNSKAHKKLHLPWINRDKHQILKDLKDTYFFFRIHKILVDLYIDLKIIDYVKISWNINKLFLKSIFPQSKEIAEIFLKFLLFFSICPRENYRLEIHPPPLLLYYNTWHFKKFQIVKYIFNNL